MTSVLVPVWVNPLDTHRGIADPGAALPRPDPRLVLVSGPTADGVLDGGWWPWTRDPAAEPPALVDRLGPVGRIELSADAWDTKPPRIMSHADEVVPRCSCGCPAG